MFGNHESAIGRCFNNWETHVGEVGNAAPLVLAISSRTLRATFNDVTRDSARRDLVPIVSRPAKLVHQRRERQAGVGCAASDHDLRAAIQRFHHRRGAEINVRALNSIANGGQRRAGIHVAQLDAARQQLIELRHDVVASDDADLQFSAETEFARNFLNRLAQPSTFTPPAFAVTRMFRSTQAGRICFISGTKSFA